MESLFKCTTPRNSKNNLMKIIAHRGNLSGPDPDNENKPDTIDYCSSKGYDVEVDFCISNDKLYFGHDEPTYEINLTFLQKRRKNLWVHCKNFLAMDMLTDTGLNYFYHDEDLYTLTSHGHIWTYPISLTKFSKYQVVLDFKKDVDFSFYQSHKVHGVCVDYV